MLPVVVRAEGRDCVGVLRDISVAGMFLYASIPAVVGTDIQVTIKPCAADPDLMVNCRGRVVRVESHEGGAATGLAVAILGYLMD